MPTPCPSCSATAVGTDIASVCTECMSISAAGASMSIPTILAMTTITVLGIMLARSAVQAVANKSRIAFA